VETGFGACRHGDAEPPRTLSRCRVQENGLGCELRPRSPLSSLELLLASVHRQLEALLGTLEIAACVRGVLVSHAPLLLGVISCGLFCCFDCWVLLLRARVQLT
jgi:hypothetical protein